MAALPVTLALTTFAAAALAVPTALEGVSLATHYAADTAVRVEVVSRFEVETVESSIEVDGESREGFGVGARAVEERRLVHVDTVLEAKDGAPTKVRRAFEEVSVESTFSIADQAQDTAHDGPLADAVIELVLEDDEVGVDVVEGSVDDELLEGHRLEHALDALLVADELEVGDEYEPDGDAVARALQADLERVLFPRPEPEVAQEGRGRGRRGMRGGAPSLARFATNGDWEATATLESIEAEFEGVACAKIALRLECSGELPEPERGEGGGRRGGGGRHLPAASPATPVPALLATEFELDADGALYVSLEDRRPLGLVLEGTLSVTSERTRTRGESEMTMTSLQEGRFEHRVTITAARAE